MNHFIRHILVCWFVILILISFGQKTYAQTGASDSLKVYAVVYNGDTIPAGRMLDVTVRTKMLEKWKSVRNKNYTVFIITLNLLKSWYELL